MAGLIKKYMEVHGTKFIESSTPKSVIKNDTGDYTVTFI